MKVILGFRELSYINVYSSKISIKWLIFFCMLFLCYSDDLLLCIGVRYQLTPNDEDVLDQYLYNSVIIWVC